MKRIVFLLMMMVFVTSLFGCQQSHLVEVENLQGTYWVEECVYLSVFSSSTLDACTFATQNIEYIEFSEDHISYLRSGTELLSYDDIKYEEVDVYQDLDDIVFLDIHDVFSNFDYRFDLFQKQYNDVYHVYEGDQFLGVSLFVQGDTWYLAETEWIGSSNDVFMIWNVYRLSSSETN